MELITDILRRNATLYGPESAIVEREPASSRRREITWKEFDRLADKVAAALMDSGIRKGDTVAMFMMNCLEWLPVYLGILRSGAWAVPLNFRFKTDDFQRCAALAAVKAVFFGPEFVTRVAQARPGLKGITDHYVFVGSDDDLPEFAVTFETWIGSEAAPVALPLLSGRDMAALYFTSGTTGTPKGVMITHDNLRFACEVENWHHGQTHEDAFLCIPPLYHTGAKMHWFGHFLVGAPAVLLKGVRPEWILEAISEERISVAWLLVPWAHDILIAIENGSVELVNYRLDHWRLMHIGAQPVPASLIRKWRTIFPHHEYDTNYGLTEATGPGCVHLGLENYHKVGAIGIPGYSWECQIWDERRKSVDQGEAGELVVRGRGVMKGYFKNPAATDDNLVDGWLLTGDIARQDSDGFIWLVDRKKDVIISGGENIFPVEIENYLMEHEDIQDVGVIGVPDRRLGEIVAAVVSLKPERHVTEAELEVFCRMLPRYQRPRRFIFDEVPRNATGKIEKPRLRRKYAGSSPPSL